MTAGRPIDGTGLIPKKSRGQNFLKDEGVADRQISAAEIKENDRILEIGPGFGILTERLVETGGRVFCIEIDPILADYTEKKFGDSVTLIRGDALKVEWPEFDVFVSNLPYSVSTPVIFKLLAHNFERAVVMVQKEFADRMVAEPGSKDYSRLTVNLFTKAECRVIENVPASRFDPRPKVDSSVVVIEPRPAPFELNDAELFSKIVDVCFAQRRKKIGTALRNSGIMKNTENLPYADSRIEMLSPAEIAELSDAVSRSVKV